MSWLRWVWKLAFIFGATFVLFFLFLGHPAQAEGVFTVTTTLDNNSADGNLSLREALLVANGSATVGFTSQEQALLGGCTFSGGNITGGCGAGITDTINFNFASGVITLNNSLGALPNINDSRPTYVNGTNNSTVEIAVDGTNLASGVPLLSVTSNHNRVMFLSFRNGPSNGVNVTGSDNDLSFIRSYGNAGAGVVINNGDRNSLYGGDFGFRWLDSPYTCNAATRNDGNDILLTGSAVSNTIQNNTVVCSPVDGILITGTTALSNVVDSNDTGTWYISGGLRNLGNTGSGIALLNGSKQNLVQYNTVGFNNQHGVRLSGSGTTSNTIINNNIGAYILANIPNAGAGVEIDSGAQSNQVLSNRIERNTLAGVLIRGSNTTGNFLSANGIQRQAGPGVQIDSGAQSNTVASNTLALNTYGVLLDGPGTSLNLITRTLIYSNTYDGIGERNQAGANNWTEISTHDNGGLGIDKFAELDATDNISAPVFSITSVNKNTHVVSGKSSGSALLIFTTVELYRIALDPSGYGEGVTFVGRTLTDSNGNWSINDPGMSGGCYTAFISTIVLVPLGSSEFSHTNCTTMLPMVRKP
jgi:hypothetical protein